MKKVYLAHPISTTGEFNDSIRVAKRVESLGKFNVYAPALNKEINDKSNNPTPQMIYKQDVQNLLASDIVIMNYTGGDSDGTVLEMGLLGGLAEAMEVLIKIRYEISAEGANDLQKAIKLNVGQTISVTNLEVIQQMILGDMLLRYAHKLPKVIVYSSNQRATKPQLYSLVSKKLYEAGVDDSLEGFIPSGKLNAMVIGLIEEYFIWCANEDEVIRKLRDYNG